MCTLYKYILVLANAPFLQCNYAYFFCSRSHNPLLPMDFSLDLPLIRFHFCLQSIYLDYNSVLQWNSMKCWEKSFSKSNEIRFYIHFEQAISSLFYSHLFGAFRADSMLYSWWFTVLSGEWTCLQNLISKAERCISNQIQSTLLSQAYFFRIDFFPDLIEKFPLVWTKESKANRISVYRHIYKSTIHLCKSQIIAIYKWRLALADL